MHYQALKCFSRQALQYKRVINVCSAGGEKISNEPLAVPDRTSNRKYGVWITRANLRHYIQKGFTGARICQRANNKVDLCGLQALEEVAHGLADEDTRSSSQYSPDALLGLTLKQHNCYHNVIVHCGLDCSANWRYGDFDDAASSPTTANRVSVANSCSLLPKYDLAALCAIEQLLRVVALITSVELGNDTSK